jgi:KDO2-lipid IV(A) lauroyltransferase
MPALYRLADVLYYFVYYMMRYRRGVVNRNMRTALHECSKGELVRLRKRYYRQLMDYTVELVKMAGTTPEFIAQRCEIVNVAHLRAIERNGRHCIIMMGHQFNWEWAHWLLNRETNFVIKAVYTPGTGRAVEQYFNRVRGKYGSELVPLGDRRSRLRPDPERPTAFLLLADQRPRRLTPRHVRWLTFLNQPTPFYVGIERLAKALDATVVFTEFRQVGRGRYKAFPHIIYQQPRAAAEGEIMTAYARLLEASIRRQPHNWLWSHRRWKHRPHAPDQMQDVPLAPEFLRQHTVVGAD